MSNTLRNRGLAGPALDATNAGLIRVEGPCAWFPATVGNDLRFVSTGAEVPVGDMIVEVGLDTSVLPFNHTGASQEVFGITTVTYGWAFRVGNAGVPFVTYRNAANTVWLAPTASSPMLTTDRWVRFVWDTSESEIEFFASEDRVVWRSLGAVALSEATAPGTVPIGQNVAINSNNNGNLFTFMPYLGAKVTTLGGTVLFNLTPEDIAAVSPAATTIATTTGPDITVTRSASGPVTTIVPSGVELIRPTDANAEQVTAPTDAAFDIGATEDAIIVFVGRGGNAADTGFPQVFGPSAPNASRFRTYKNTGASVIAAEVRTAAAESANYSTVAGAGAPVGYAEQGLYLFALRLDRATARVSTCLVDASGTVLRSYTNPAAVPASAIDNGGFLVQDVGGFRQAMFRKGAGIAAEYTDTDLAALAAYLLEN